MRKRQIIKVGGSWDIRLTPADIIDFDLSEGDFVDIDDINVLEVNDVENAD